MKKQIRFAFVGVLSLVLMAAAGAVPPTSHNTISNPAAVIEQTGAQAQSVSGTISAIDKSSFTLTLQQPSHDVDTREKVALQDPPKSMTFLVDKNTTIEGTMQVGSNADVTYRDDDAANHVALGVRVK